MRTEVKYDFYDILGRLREIDGRLSIMWNTLSSKYEVHFAGISNTLLLTLPYDRLDSRAVEYYKRASIHNVDFESIDRQNDYLDDKASEDRKYENHYKLKEMLDFGNKLSQDVDFSSPDSRWI